MLTAVLARKTYIVKNVIGLRRFLATSVGKLNTVK